MAGLERRTLGKQVPTRCLYRWHVDHPRYPHTTSQEFPTGKLFLGCVWVTHPTLLACPLAAWCTWGRACVLQVHYTGSVCTSIGRHPRTYPPEHPPWPRTRGRAPRGTRTARRRPASGRRTRRRSSAPGHSELRPWVGRRHPCLSVQAKIYVLLGIGDCQPLSFGSPSFSIIGPKNTQSYIHTLRKGSMGEGVSERVAVLSESSLSMSASG